MKSYLTILIISTSTVFGQGKKVEIQNSPKSTVIIGNGNTVNHITLLAPFAIMQNPSSRFVQLGKGCVFNVKVIGGRRPYKYKWFINETAIRYETADSLMITNVKLSDHNSGISVLITDANHNIIKSENAKIKVTQDFFVGYSKVDPYVDDSTVPNIENISRNTLCHDSSVIFHLPRDAGDAFWIAKVPDSEPVNVSWYNSDLNYGDIPDGVIRKPFKISGFNYYITRSEFVFNYRQPIVMQSH